MKPQLIRKAADPRGMGDLSSIFNSVGGSLQNVPNQILGDVASGLASNSQVQSQIKQQAANQAGENLVTFLQQNPWAIWAGAGALGTLIFLAVRR